MPSWKELNERRNQEIREDRAEHDARLSAIKVTYVEVGDRENIHPLTRLCCHHTTAEKIGEWCKRNGIHFYSVESDGHTSDACRMVRDDQETSRMHIIFGCVLEGDPFQGWDQSYDPLRRGAR